MKNHDNQNQPNERKIYLKDLHQWVPVSKTDYDNYYSDINAYRRRQQEHGYCVCPANKRYLCDMDCWTCRFHKAGDALSLDYTMTDEDGNEKSWLDDLANDAPSTQSILEERELLYTLICKLDELDPDGRRICELLLQEKSEREIAAIMGVSGNQPSTIRRKKHLKLCGSSYTTTSSSKSIILRLPNFGGRRKTFHGFRSNGILNSIG